MLGAVVQNVFVNFVGDRQHIPFLAEIGDKLELFAAEYLPCWVIRRINNDRLRLVVERCRQFRFVKRPIGPAKLNVARGCAGNDRVRSVIFVERLEDDHFIAGIDHRKQNIDHGFG